MFALHDQKNGRRWFITVVLLISVTLLILTLTTLSITPITAAELNNSAASTLHADSALATLVLIKETNPDGGTGFSFTVASIGATRTWGSWGSNDGQFNYPGGVEVDGVGAIYVADLDNNRIQKFDSNGLFLGTWGSWGSGNGQFKKPFAVAFDSAGNIYVADRENHRIQKFDSNMQFQSKWGSFGSSAGQLWDPYGVTVDSFDNIYVSDSGNNRIQKFDSDGVFLLAWGFDVIAGNAETGFEICTPSDTCQQGSSGTGNGQFWNPFGGTVDQQDNFYVADRNNHRIQMFDNSGNFLAKWGNLGNSAGEFNNPDGLAFDAIGNIYVADTDNHRIQKFDSDGNFLLAWGFDVIAGNANTDFEICRPTDICKEGSWGNGNGQLKHAHDVAADAFGNVFVADTHNHRIQKFFDTIVTLDDDEQVTYTLDPATYLINEVIPAGWLLHNITCDGGNPQVSDESVTVMLVSGANVTCTFTNMLPNSLPLAVDNTYSTRENQPLNVDAPGVLANDTDANNDMLTAVKVTDPAHGPLVFNIDGSFTYTPTTTFVGVDTFTYKANDGTDDSNEATVSIYVNSACDAMSPGLVGYAPSYFGDPKRLDVQGDYAYMVDWHGSLMVFDISDPCNPLPLGSAQHTAQEFQDVVVDGDYAYVANDANGLAIYDVSDVNAPWRVTARKDGGGYANSISFDGGQYAVVSQHYSGGTELVIYDMSTFPSSTPIIYSTGPGWPHVWEAYMVGDRVYLCAADGSGGLRFQILDISGLPSVPVLLGSLDLPAASYGDGFKIDVQGDYAYLTSGESGAPHDGGLMVVNISNETTPYVEGEVFIPNAGIVSWKKPGLDIVDDEIYLMGRDGLYGFDVSDKSNPTQFVNFPFPTSFGSTAGGDITIRDDLGITSVTYPEPGSVNDHGGIAIYRLKANILMSGNLVSNDLYLVWTDSGDAFYDLFRSTHPYDAYEWRATTDQPEYVESEAGINDSSNNYFFEVRGQTQGAVSNRMGVFTFGIVDGN